VPRVTRSMHQLFHHFCAALLRLMRRRPSHPDLTAVEYEAVCLIAYEGRDAHARAREQAAYCRSRGSLSGTSFWTEVAAEIAWRTGKAQSGQTQRLPR
jgi:hypothetical protein